MPPVDQLEADITAAAVRALRKRAEAISKRAAPGVVVLDGYRRPVVVITSETAASLKIAKDFDRIAAEIETETRP